MCVCLSKKTMEMMFVSQDLRDITPAASSFSLSPMRHCMVGRRSHFGPVGLGLENPSEHICPGLYKGRKTGGGGCLRYPMGRPGPELGKAWPQWLEGQGQPRWICSLSTHGQGGCGIRWLLGTVSSPGMSLRRPACHLTC